jgi:hypothetical protein
VVWSLPLDFGNNTKTEPRLTLDVGALGFERPRKLYAFVGYQDWLDKSGNDHTQVPGALTSTVFFGLRYHL